MNKWKIVSITGIAVTSLVLGACGQVEKGVSSQTSSASAVSQVVSATKSQGQSDYFTERDKDASYDETTATKIALSGASATVSGQGASVSGSTVTIEQEGTYILSGASQGVQVVVRAADTAKVQLVLDNVTMTAQTAPVLVEEADKVFITLAENSVNQVSDSTGDSETDAAIFSKSDLTFNGNGQVTVIGQANNAIESNDDVRITGGRYVLTAVGHAINANDAISIVGADLVIEAGEDGLHADHDEDTSLGNIYLADSTLQLDVGDDAIHATNELLVDSGSIDIASSTEGLEGKVVTINDGTIRLYATDDGINASDWTKSSDSMMYMEGVSLTINGGELTIEMASGDTDAIDSNGDLVVTGGTINITGQSAFDFDGTVTYTGGEITVNGEQLTEIVAHGPGGMSGGRPR